MKILLVSSANNSLTQHARVLLADMQHEVLLAEVISSEEIREQVLKADPDLVLCPMLTKIIPDDIWQRYTCIVIHPGIAGDRGPSSLDWAIMNQESEWGVTAVEAAEHADSGAIWATHNFEMRHASKSSLYRDEVTIAATKAIMVAVTRFEGGHFVPAPLDYSKPNVNGRCRPQVKQFQRKIDWNNDTTGQIVRKIQAADSVPGVLDTIDGKEYFLFGAHTEGRMVGKPGEILATRHGAICRASVDGAVWISHLKKRKDEQGSYFKLPATLVLGEHVASLPENTIDISYQTDTRTYREIWYQEENDVGYVHFRFYNGAMSSAQCERLTEAVEYAKSRPTKVIVLSGGRDFWSNGIHLNVIEAAADCAEESWRNINAIDDLCLALLAATNHLTIASMYGSAGAGGVMLALTADRIFARKGIVLNPHYKTMGGLYGSEYWTYSLPKRIGQSTANQLTDECQPIGVEHAKRIGLIDDIILQDGYGSTNFMRFRQQVTRIAEKLAQANNYQELLSQKQASRAKDEAQKPLAHYRAEELEHMRANFFGPDKSYHLARSHFVRKTKVVIEAARS